MRRIALVPLTLAFPAVLHACSGSTTEVPDADAGPEAGGAGDAAGVDALAPGIDAANEGGAAFDASRDAPAEAAPDYDPPATCGATVPALKLTKVAEGFTRPVLALSPPSDARLFVVEQDGLVKIVKNGVTNALPFLDLRTVVPDYYASSEEGLLGLAFHPSFAQNGRFFVDYVTRASPRRTIVAEYRRSNADPDRADPDPVGQPLLVVNQPFANHNGGMIEFGKDGYLVVGMGDGGDARDPNDNGQTITSRLGKLLRLDVDAPATAPPGNMGNGADSLVFAWGLRNPWRFSHDRKTGDIYIGDVGQSAYEEVDVNPVGVAGRNYGWRCREGKHATPGVTACTPAGAIDPVLEHGAGAPPTFTSMTGGYVYRGAAIPCMRGRYVYGDFGSGGVHTFRWDGTTGVLERKNLTSDLMPIAPFNVSSFGQDAAGELYVLEYSPGRVWRIDAR